MKTFEMKSVVNATPEQVYQWHQRKFAFERVMPPWENTSCEINAHRFKNGMTCRFTFKIGPINFNWDARYKYVVENTQFVDVQEKGPFTTWVHTHRFEPVENGKTAILDHVQYQLPFGRIGDIFGGKYAHRRLVAMFTRRHNLLQHDFSLPPQEPKKILISGASGFVGGALIPLLTSQGHGVYRLVRKKRTLNDTEIHLW